MIARKHVAAGACTRGVLALAGVSESTFYDRPKSGIRGRRATSTTLDVTGRVWTEEQLLAVIIAELEREFVDYGYIKVTKWLRHQHRLVINKKKVYRLMARNGLLNRRPIRSTIDKQWIKDLVPNPAQPLTHLEFDIKYLHIHGSRRNAMMLTVIDVKSRFNLGWLLQWSIRKEDVVALFDDIRLTIPMVSKITVQSDNGSQFVSHHLREHVQAHGIDHEFTRPAMPEQNAHIECYHSIVERTICKHYTFTDLNDANDVLTRWVQSYNHERIHSGVGFISPAEYLTNNNVSLPQTMTSTTHGTNFSIN